MTSSLDQIFTSDQAVDQELLGSILLPFVKVNVEDNSIFFTDEGNALAIPEKLILFLLARKALKIKSKIETETVSPAEIIKMTQLKDGSVHPNLKILREKNLVIVKDGKYFIPNHQLTKIKSMFGKK